MRAAVVIVGDELLSGHVRDANGHFIATRLAAHGHPLDHMSIVGDDPAAIAAAVRRGAEAADIVFVCGGVGPTHDDRTMEGVASAAGTGLERCEPIAQRIEQIARHLADAGLRDDPLGTEDLLKMAMIPKGAEVLPAGGFIPAVVVPVPSSTVVILPGPPKELEAVFTQAVEPRYLAGTGEDVHREEVTHPFPESAVADMLVRLARDFPEVSVGSYPMDGYSLVRITGGEASVAGAATRLRAEIEAFRESDRGRSLLAYLEGRRSGG